MFKFDKDLIVIPNESEWFEDLDSQGQIVPFRETDLYKNDLLGL